MSEFTFKALDLARDREGLLALLRLGFPETAGKPENTSAFLAWKFASDRSVGTSEVGFDADDRLVSFYGVIPMEYKIGGTTRTLGLVCDVMSHPDVRRRGLFAAAGRSAMARLEATDIDGVTGYPIRDDVMPGHLKVGWSVHFRMPVYVASTGARVPDSRLQSLGGLVGSLPPFVAMAAGRRNDSRPVGLGELATVSEALTETLAASGTNIAKRDSGYLDWRLARPGAKYLLRTAHSDRGSASAVARETTLRGVPALAVLDIVGDDRGAVRAVVQDLWTHARQAKLPLMAFCSNPATARRLGLTTMGFIRTPLSFRLIARSTSPRFSAGAFDADSAWHLTWLDADTL